MRHRMLADILGSSVSYEIAGEGRPIVFVHGLGGTGNVGMRSGRSCRRRARSSRSICPAPDVRQERDVVFHGAMGGSGRRPRRTSQSRPFRAGLAFDDDRFWRNSRRRSIRKPIGGAGFVWADDRTRARRQGGVSETRRLGERRKEWSASPISGWAARFPPPRAKPMRRSQACFANC